MTTPNGKRCEECGDPLTGQQRVICSRRVKPECHDARASRKTRLWWKRYYGTAPWLRTRRKGRTPGPKGPYKEFTYCVKDIQPATPEKLIKIINTMAKEA